MREWQRTTYCCLFLYVSVVCRYNRCKSRQLLLADDITIPDSEPACGFSDLVSQQKYVSSSLVCDSGRPSPFTERKLRRDCRRRSFLISFVFAWWPRLCAHFAVKCVWLWPRRRCSCCRKSVTAVPLPPALSKARSRCVLKAGA